MVRPMCQAVEIQGSPSLTVQRLRFMVEFVDLPLRAGTLRETAAAQPWTRAVLPVTGLPASSATISELAVVTLWCTMLRMRRLQLGRQEAPGVYTNILK